MLLIRYKPEKRKYILSVCNNVPEDEKKKKKKNLTYPENRDHVGVGELVGALKG